ncbi:MAG: tetratricopeptide repeat protein [Anaerolineae bacterium]|jgi:tetratricopeptide (TPR) repeat protein
MNSTKLSAFCDKVMELGWLLAVIVTPLFFNVNSSNVFERDKWTLLRTIALIMVAFWLVRLVEEWISNGKPDLRITWRTPLVLPILLMILSYVISTIFSVTPYISIFGGYQRLRGVFSALSCIVICLIVLDRLQTREQAERFITVMILNSLPIALYGFIQHAGLDPLPWGGDVTRRIASSMGNAIFVAAYMILAAIPTLARVVEAFQAILTDEETGAADVLRAAAYIFLLLVQIISIFYSQSRGPLLGLVAGVGVWALLGLLALQRAAQREQPFQSYDLGSDLGRGLLFGLASLAAAGVGGAIFYFVGLGIDALWAGQLPEAPLWAGVIGAGLAFLFLWGAFIINRRGWRWLWVGALFISILFAVFFMLINLVDPIHEWSRQLPFLGRLDDVLYGSGGTTGKVRAYIWEGALEMILPHDPIEFPPTAENPEWRPDAFNFLRPIVGYGPESMYVAYNRFYPPELGHVESRTATPDRSHNETLDTLVITGLLGLAAYLWTFGGIFYYGLRWLGFLPKDWRRILFFVLLVGGAVGAVVLSGILLGFHFFGLAIPVGMVGGLFLYLIVYGFSLYWEPQAVPEPHSHFGLLTGILAAVVAYFIEVNFGIAIASTRTILWTLTGMLVVIGMGQIHDRIIESQERKVEVKQAGSRRRKRRKRRQVVTRSSPDWMGSILALGVVGGFILGTLAFDFISTNPEGLPNAWKIVWRALTIRPFHGQAFSPGVLIIFVFTWLMSAVVFVAQMSKQGAFRKRERDWARAAGVYLSVSLVVGMGFALVMASRHVSLGIFLGQLQQRAQDQTQPLSNEEYLAAVVFYADMISNHMTTYYVFIVFALVAGAGALYHGMRQQIQVAVQRWGVVALVVSVLVVGFGSVMANLRPIQADMVYKSALSYEKESPPMAIELFKHAIELAPNEDFYDFEIGRVYLLNAGSSPGNAEEAIKAFVKAQSIAPLNTDHVKGLAKSYQVWAKIAAASGDTARYQERLQRADEYYEIATSLSPHNAFLQNERVKFYLDEGNFARAEEAIAVSLEIDSEYYDTWMLLGDLHRAQEDWADAAQVYERALEVDPRHADVWSLLGGIYIEKLNRPADAARAFVGLGDMYADQGSLPEAIQAYNQALSLDSDLNDDWEFHRRLANAYDRMGQSDLAISHAREALRLAPDEEQAGLQTWLAELQAPGGVLP